MTALTVNNGVRGSDSTMLDVTVLMLRFANGEAVAQGRNAGSDGYALVYMHGDRDAWRKHMPRGAFAVRGPFWNVPIADIIHPIDLETPLAESAREIEFFARDMASVQVQGM